MDSKINEQVAAMVANFTVRNILVMSISPHILLYLLVFGFIVKQKNARNMRRAMLLSKRNSPSSNGEHRCCPSTMSLATFLLLIFNLLFQMVHNEHMYGIVLEQRKKVHTI